MIWGINARTTMFDKDEAAFEMQNAALHKLRCRSIYYAVQDDEFDWFKSSNGILRTKKLFQWWLASGSEVLFPVADSNVGVEASVAPFVWSRYLDDRGGWAAMARKDLISAIIRTKHQDGWNFLLSDIARVRSEFSGMAIKGVIGPDLYAFHTDAYLSQAPMNWARLTPQGKTKVEMLGTIKTGNPFLEFAAQASQVFGSQVISDGCFLYDEGSFQRVTSMYGSLTRNIVEFGADATKPDAANRLRNLFTRIRSSNPIRALLHSAVAPSYAWLWKMPTETMRLWTDQGYDALSPAHPWAFWARPELRAVVQAEMGR